jgi:hypothetical protein
MYPKTLKNISIVFLICALFQSCSSDDNLNVTTTTYVSELCSVKGWLPVYLLSDDGRTLNPVSSDDLGGFVENDRVFVTYNIVGQGQNLSKTNNYQINIYDIQSIPVLDVISRADLEYSISDPISMLSTPWLGGGFLNVEFSFGHSTLNIKHSLFMVYEGFENKDGKNIINLTFGHNAKSDPSVINSPAFASFRLNGINNIDKADSIFISVYNGFRVVKYHIGAK